MKLLKKIAKVLGISLSIILVGCASVPKLSKAEKEIISEVVKTPIPEIIQGETGFANSGKHQIWFESIRPKIENKGAVVLIMGNGNDALTWPPQFISSLVGNGYQVIRYDHRGTGLSISEEKWKKKKAYSLNDMAGDIISILDVLKIKKAHIVGISMGGMIGQIVAIENPERTISLTSIMSSGDPMDPTLPQMSNEIVPEMISAIFKHGFFGGKKGQVQRQIIQKRILMGKATGEIDIRTMAQTSLYNLKKREGYKLMSARHHYNAILNSSSRYVQLSQIKIPTLIIHGREDPVIPILHSEKLAKIIPNAETLWVNNMGHDLPDGKIIEITKMMLLNFERASSE
ncbi:alpha/beta hydrolase [Maribacter algarum]|uniref:Alpha/beta hydrolase n=1 Tax=Maribacter algarum (ex Zhang et al. 2020) TaxID=2578118 RepID=A0A5S3PV74_9FLAO|nr:alpha/beta hydrolase [Maribacter algarum]TMM58850.1 alpha/beta hydrolase [Maribacter algarum]